MLIELTDAYKPQKILYRDKQVAEIKNLFNNFREYKISNNIFIMGVTGSGKTLTINKIIEEEDPESYLYVSGTDRTSTKTFKKLFWHYLCARRC